MKFKAAVKAMLRWAGYEIRRILPPSSSLVDVSPGSMEWWRKTQDGSNRIWLERLGCLTVIDVGASVGSFSEMALALFPHAMVHGFEPLADDYRRLAARFGGNPRFKPHSVALGAQRGTRILLRSAYAPSSSFLPMADAHVRSFPFTRDVTSEPVRVERLDDVLAAEDIQDPLCVKLDVQGFEAEVVEGGRKTIARAALLIVEMSVEKLYENQPLFDALYRTLHGLGFDYAGNLAQLLSPEDGRVLQVDAIFRRRSG